MILYLASKRIYRKAQTNARTQTHTHAHKHTRTQTQTQTHSPTKSTRAHPLKRTYCLASYEDRYLVRTECVP